MNSYLQETTLSNRIKDLDNLLKSKKFIVYTIVPVNIENWEINANLQPILAISDKGLFLKVGNNEVELAYDDFSTLIMKGIIKIEMSSSEKIAFGSLNPKENKILFELIQKLYNHEKINSDFLSSLPDQRSPGFFAQKSLYLFITGILMITIGFAIQPTSFVWAWFMVVGGLLVMLIGVIVTIIQRKFI